MATTKRRTAAQIAADAVAVRRAQVEKWLATADKRSALYRARAEALRGEAEEFQAAAEDHAAQAKRYAIELERLDAAAAALAGGADAPR